MQTSNFTDMFMFAYYMLWPCSDSTATVFSDAWKLRSSVVQAYRKCTVQPGVASNSKSYCLRLPGVGISGVSHLASSDTDCLSSSFPSIEISLKNNAQLSV